MKRILVLAAVSVLAFASMATASPSGTVELNAGYSKSSNEVIGTESMGGGISFGAGYWRNASPQISWGLEAGFDNLGSVEDTSVPANPVEFSSSAFRVNPALRFNMGQSAGPSFYAQAGGGLYNVSMKIEDTTGSVDDSQSKFGFNVGAGVSFPVSPKSRANITGLYHSVSTEGESLNYLQFRAGIGFNL